MHVLCKIVFFMCKTLIEQAHPAPFFCKIAFRGSKYFLEISKARERLMTVASKTFGVSDEAIKPSKNFSDDQSFLKTFEQINSKVTN